MHVSEEQLKSYVSGALSEKDLDHLKGHFDECRSCRTRLAKSRNGVQQTAETSSPTGHDERRREPRIPTKGSASVQMISPMTPDPMEAQVLDVSRNGLKIRVPRFLKIGAILGMQLRDMWIVGEVRYCVQTEEGFCAGLYIQDCVERRSAERSRVDIPATIGELLSDQPARILDQSTEGMLIVAQHRVSQGSTVRIAIEGKVIFARVVYCNRDVDRFKIGVRIDQVLKL
ncbi:MAG TPA: PilZ domain-containing protein [Bryobacteraceae bacterium]|nr:PilZ domain-containing protein [Bryobacteraceae bacterium]